MSWFLGCLGLVFVIFGGCIFGASLLAFPTGSDTGFLTAMLIVGALILILGVWVFYKAVTVWRTPPGIDPARPD